MFLQVEIEKQVLRKAGDQKLSLLEVEHQQKLELVLKATEKQKAVTDAETEKAVMEITNERRILEKQGDQKVLAHPVAHHHNLICRSRRCTTSSCA